MRGFIIAENESLELVKAPRWQRVHRAVMVNESIESVAQEAVISLYRTVRVIRKLIPFDQLLTAACNDPDALPALIHRCDKGREFAHLFQFVAEKGKIREDLLQAYFETVCDRFLDQIEANSFPSERWTNLPDLRCHFAQVRVILRDDIKRIAHKLADNSDWLPRVRPNRKGSSSTQALLDESLLRVPRE